MKPVLALSLGCPSGVGPEVAVRAALSTLQDSARMLLVGDAATVHRALELVAPAHDVMVRLIRERAELGRVKPNELALWADSATPASTPLPGEPDREAGRAQLAWVDQACDLVHSGFADALVTGPVSKHAIVASKAPGSSGFIGHTEHLAERLRSKEVVMAFWSDTLTTALVTTHMPLAKVSASLTPTTVATAIYWLADLLRVLGHTTPRVAVCGVNPHAGEGGVLGDDETRSIGPGVERARERIASAGFGAEIQGPMSAETAFRRANGRPGQSSRYDGVVAMYHDQATIPMKLVAFGDAVNVTLGLPIVRTSVDHGTAYDIAWRKPADASGMIEAVRLATRLVHRA